MTVKRNHEAVVVVNSSVESSYGFLSFAEAVAFIEDRATSSNMPQLIADVMTEGVTINKNTYQMFDYVTFADTFIEDDEESDLD